MNKKLNYLCFKKEIRTHVTTEEAAFYLNRRPQTLRAWICNNNSPIKPIKINGRLAWPVSAIRKLLNIE